MKIKYFLLFLIPIFIILFNINALIFNYNYENDVHHNLIDFFNGKELKFDYTERELIHLYDVKLLINLLRVTIYILASIILLILIFNKEKILDVLLMSGLITIGIALILSLINFNALFIKFHETLFTNNYWMLSSDTLLIKTYPIEFFISFFKRLILNIIIVSLILIGVGLLKNVHTQYKSCNS